MTSKASSRTQIETLLQLINSSAQEAMFEYEKTGYGIPSPDSAEPHPLDNQPGALALRKAIRTLESACERLCTTLAQPMHTLVNVTMPFESPCLKFVADEQIADILETNGGEGMFVDEIADRMKNKVASDKLGQVMLLLATRGCFREGKIQSFLFPLLRPYLDFIWNVKVLQAVAMLPETLVHPEYAFSKTVNRTSFSYSIRNEMENASRFDWLKVNPQAGERFQRAMKGFSILAGSSDAVVQEYPWDKLMNSASGNNSLKFCDVGSGPGAVALALSKHYNNKFRVVLQDLPEPLTQAKIMWSTEYPEADVNFVSLDFLKESPVSGQDVYFLSYVLHDWPDSDAIIILKNIANAMNDTSRLLIHEGVLEHACTDSHDSDQSYEKAPEPLLPNYGTGKIRTYNHNINMLSIYNSRERTREDFIALGENSGLTLTKIWPLSETCLLEFKLTDSSL
ncbi:S-adenosyl-L-methionine-dependent methyltransferase [Marasmius fiardii PR-910]|nr:S-adenosyl-L-methionine-dependent methyltransferase [Marasmius fiardii PR-910]